MSAPHDPVLIDEVIVALRPERGETIIDATFGAGGYSRAILAAGAGRLIGFDRDPAAIAAAPDRIDSMAERLSLVEAPFSALADHVPGTSVDGVVFDIGVSSMQLDQGERGFSFRFDGPLSMRMDGGRPDAADVLAVANADDLKLIFKVYGEESRAAPLARAIVRAREEAPIRSTGALVKIIEAASPSPHAARRAGAKPIHPATRVFQALRIFVNNELGELVRGLIAAETVLKPLGRLVVVTFHSLEARIVKRFFADRTGRADTASRHEPLAEGRPATFEQPVRKAIEPQAEETERNPRARSAQLRWGVRTEFPARGASDTAFAGLPRLSFSADLRSLNLPVLETV